ncbi:MAG: TatD family hydrolase [Clostridia bacterium]|nr:TatD family hydrolase [Clostridia bacterium]
MRLFDSHCHISDEAFDENRDALIEKIRASHVALCTDVGSDLITSINCAAAAEKYDFVYAAAGCHPHEAESFSEGQLEQILELLKQPKVKALGEIGLDYHYDFSPRDVQQYWFAAQLSAAKEIGCPIIIHSREAEEDSMRILKDSGVFGRNRVVIHCFSGSAELARQYVKLGATISLAGPVTFKNARKPVEVVQTIPLEHLLVETDSPYMAPVPYRGQTNTPVLVEEVARKFAEIKGLDIEEVAETTFRNACEFYGVQIPAL